MPPLTVTEAPERFGPSALELYKKNDTAPQRLAAGKGDQSAAGPRARVGHYDVPISALCESCVGQRQRVGVEA